MNAIKQIFLLATLTFFIGCGGGGGGGGGQTGIDVVFVDSYIKDANITDSADTPVRYKSDTKLYHFYDIPKGKITASGGVIIDSDIKNQMTYKVDAKTRVISPLTHFLHLYPNRNVKLANILKVGVEHLGLDYIRYNLPNLAKFAQIIYALEINGLLEKFEKTLDQVDSLDGALLSANAVSIGHKKKNEIEAFLYAVKNSKDIKNLEIDIKDKKIALVDESTSIYDKPAQTNTNPTQTEFKGIVVKNALLKDKKTIKIEFSENIKLNDTGKEAFKFVKANTTDINLSLKDATKITASGSSVSFELGSALEFKEDTSYTLEVLDNLKSAYNESPSQKTTSLLKFSENLKLLSTEYLSPKSIRANFNLPLKQSSLSKDDFFISDAKISIKASKVELEPNGLDQSLIISFLNQMKKNGGYDLHIGSENLQSKSDKKLEKDAKQEFIASKNIGKPEGFYLENAFSDGDKIIANFSKNVSTNLNLNLFKIRKRVESPSFDMNISFEENSSKLLKLKLTKDDDNISFDENTSYKLSIEKQKFFSTDGARTLGQTYTKEFTKF